jgi:hypothetical protein
MPGMHFGPITGTNAPFVVQVTNGQTSFNAHKGLKINKDQRFIEFYNNYICHKDEGYPKIRDSDRGTLASNSAFKVYNRSFQREDALELHDQRTGSDIPPTYISFRRTVRIPEEAASEGLPVHFGPFPLFSVETYANKMTKAMIRMGGLFFPMFQREALSICFHGDGPMPTGNTAKSDYDYMENYAVRIYSGSVNVITGNQGNSKEHDSAQDFAVIPKQERLDGFCTGRDTVRQFVAMPLGNCYSFEQQINGEEWLGGIQLEIAPRYKTSVNFSQVKDGNSIDSSSLLCSNEAALETPLDLFQTPSEAGFVPGQFLIMHALDMGNHQPIRNIKFDPTNFPREEFFGAGSNAKDHKFYRGRPTFLRELSAWTARVYPHSNIYQLQAVSPISISVIWKACLVEMANKWLKSKRTPLEATSATFRLSPFLDIDRISFSVLSEEADVQHILNYPHGLFGVRPSGASSLDSARASYMPLFLFNTDELSFSLFDLRIGASGPPRMALGAGGERQQRIAVSQDKRMFAWEQAVMINIHILNSVSFHDITGFLLPPPPISFKEYTGMGFPFYSSHRDEVTLNSGSLSLVKSVQELDLKSDIVWDVQVGDTKSVLTGCAFCETNLADTL